jgi:hypothetical protein
MRSQEYGNPFGLIPDFGLSHPLQSQAGTAPHRPEGELVVLPAEAFDALASRLEQPGHYDPRVARVLSRKAPWE